MRPDLTLPAGVQLAYGGGLPSLLIHTQHSFAQLYAHGAHVSSWMPHPHEMILWMSDQSVYALDKPLRGGVPLIFPWFGPRADHPEAPSHGFARVHSWELQEVETADDITLRFRLASNPETSALWPHRFEAQFSVTVGVALTMQLQVTNTDASAWSFEAALHTYFAVGDVRQVQVTGLENTRYLDKTDAMREKTQHGPISITSETDRVYLDTKATCTLHDPVLKRRIIVEKSGSDSTVVWNPWIEKAAKMPDFGDDEWSQMLCIETANVGDSAITLEAQQSHSMSARIAVEAAL